MLIRKGLAHRLPLKGDAPMAPHTPSTRANSTATLRQARGRASGADIEVAEVGVGSGARDSDESQGDDRPKKVLLDDNMLWHAVNSRFTFEGAVDIAQSPAYHGARLLFDSDELSITVAPQGQRDPSILAIGEMVILLDADGRSAKMGAGARRRVPRNARIACSFGCQPGRAQNYVAAWDPLNIGARSGGGSQPHL